MFFAAVAVLLLVWSGPSGLSVGALVVAVALSLTSLWLFRTRG